MSCLLLLCASVVTGENPTRLATRARSTQAFQPQQMQYTLDVTLTGRLGETVEVDATGLLADAGVAVEAAGAASKHMSSRGLQARILRTS